MVGWFKGGKCAKFLSISKAGARGARCGVSAVTPNRSGYVKRRRIDTSIRSRLCQAWGRSLCLHATVIRIRGFRRG
jgi:hypothetical protein